MPGEDKGCQCRHGESYDEYIISLVHRGTMPCVKNIGTHNASGMQPRNANI